MKDELKCCLKMSYEIIYEIQWKLKITSRKKKESHMKFECYLRNYKYIVV